MPSRKSVGLDPKFANEIMVAGKRVSEGLVYVGLVDVVKAYVCYDRGLGVGALLLELCGSGRGVVASGMSGDKVSQLRAAIRLRVKAPGVCGKTVPVLFGVVINML